MRISDWSSDVCSSDLIGLGKRLAAVVARRFAPENAILATTAAAVDEITATTSAPILIKGNDGQAVQLAPCCGPLPGDAIIGGIRLGYGLVIHMARSEERLVGKECVSTFRYRW